MAVILTKALQRAIFDQLEAGYPHERGGFLLGHLTPERIEVVEVVAVENAFAAEEQYHRYAMTPADWARLEDEAEARGLALLGYYHSHPDAAPVPSEYDRAHALPNFAYLITSVQHGRAVAMRAWQLRPDRSRFDALGLVVTD